MPIGKFTQSHKSVSALKEREFIFLAAVNRLRCLRSIQNRSISELARQWFLMTQIVRLSGKPVCYRLTCEVRLAAPLEDVFAFFADASQLERLTPAWLKFSVLSPSPISMHEGAIIDYKLRVHDMPLKWRSKIAIWDPPHQFADEQIRGPYRCWYHVHSFEREGDATICRDEVEYSIFGGALVHSLFVKRDLERIFTFRTRTLQEIFNKPCVQGPAVSADFSRFPN
jgi:ligand-binding SRPBCC domain-containing protein